MVYVVTRCMTLAAIDCGRRKVLHGPAAQSPAAAELKSALVKTKVVVMFVGVASSNEANRADAVVGHVQVFAKHIDDLEADVAVPVEKAEQIPAAHFGELQGLQSFGGDFVGTAGQGGAQAEELSRAGKTHGHAAAAFRADRKAYSALAQEEDATSNLAFTKQDGAPLAGLDLLDMVEFLESVGLQVTENTVGALPAVNTAQRHKFPLLM